MIFSAQPFLKISRILHAGYIFETTDFQNGLANRTQIAFDPIFENPFSRNCHAFPAVTFDKEQIEKLRLAAVFISHYHDDHCSFESLNLLHRDTPIYLYCIFDELFDWIHELGFKNVFPLRLNETIEIGDIKITPRRALDVDVDSLFQIEACGVKVLNVVDSWIDEDTLTELVQQGPWDMVLWPFQTMRELEVLAPSRAAPAPATLPEEWLRQLKALKPKYVIPSSCQFLQEDWSWYNHAFFPVTYCQFQQELEAAVPEAEVFRLNPSCSIKLSSKELLGADPLPWIRPVGNQDVDYDYRPQIKAPPTAEIAKNFTALNSEQAERVYQYCQQELAEKYFAMDPPEDPYFKKPRLWRLSLYDHQGTATDHWFLLEKNHLKPATADESTVAWTTEVPAAKLYAALELGESLTSMYLRINDFGFSDEIEGEIGQADIVEDPLIRCLFNGRFGAYQQAQLQQLISQSRLRNI